MRDPGSPGVDEGWPLAQPGGWARPGALGGRTPPVLPAWATVLGGRVRRADAMLWSRADHADKTTAGQTVTVGEAQSVPRYSGIEYSADDQSLFRAAQASEMISDRLGLWGCQPSTH